MTNGDLIRNASDEQLAEFMANDLFRIGKPIFDRLGYGIEMQAIYVSRLSWLKQEIDNAKNSD